MDGEGEAVWMVDIKTKGNLRKSTSYWPSVVDSLMTHPWCLSSVFLVPFDLFVFLIF